MSGFMPAILTDETGRLPGFCQRPACVTGAQSIRRPAFSRRQFLHSAVLRSWPSRSAVIGVASPAGVGAPAGSRAAPDGCLVGTVPPRRPGSRRSARLCCRIQRRGPRCAAGGSRANAVRTTNAVVLASSQAGADRARRQGFSTPRPSQDRQRRLSHQTPACRYSASASSSKRTRRLTAVGDPIRPGCERLARRPQVSLRQALGVPAVQSRRPRPPRPRPGPRRLPSRLASSSAATSARSLTGRANAS